MGVKGKLRTLEGEKVAFWCNGCNMFHAISVNKSDRVHWDFNNNYDNPTFTPSILVRYPWGEERKENVCHSFVTDGKIQYLNDCTHELAGKTIELPNIEDGEADE